VTIPNKGRSQNLHVKTFKEEKRHFHICEEKHTTYGRDCYVKTSVGVDLVVDFPNIQMTAHETQRSQRQIYKAASTSTGQLSSPHQNEGNSLRKLVGLKQIVKNNK
jgi:hypothetical protein